MNNEIDNITYKVAELLDRRNDFPFVQSLKDTLWNMRATFLRRDFDKNLIYRPSSIQDLGCIPLVDVPKEECSVPDGCKLKRTESKIPLPIETNFQNHYMYVGSTDGSPDYQPISEFEKENLSENLFPSLYPSYFVKNGFLYVLNGGNQVNVRTMFKDPREAAKFAANESAKCDVLTNAYIPKDMVNLIEQEIYKFYSIERLPETDEVKL